MQKRSQWLDRMQYFRAYKLQVSQDVIGYLPTIDAPATDMATVHEVLVQSLKIKSTLKLKSIVLVFDQTLYAKASEVQWKQSEIQRYPAEDESIRHSLHPAVHYWQALPGRGLDGPVRRIWEDTRRLGCRSSRWAQV